jgi:hypothetical protein
MSVNGKAKRNANACSDEAAQKVGGTNLSKSKGSAKVPPKGIRDQKPGAPVEAGRTSGDSTVKRRRSKYVWARDMRPV